MTNTEWSAKGGSAAVARRVAVDDDPFVVTGVNVAAVA